MIKILLNGMCGHMGGEVCKAIEKENEKFILAGGIDAFSAGSDNIPCANTFSDANTDVDVIIDFSHRSLTHELLQFAIANNIPAVIATTGQTDEELEEIKLSAKKIPIFFSANMSFGIALLCELAKKTASALPQAEIEIVEAHHSRKLDSPSGTAKMLVEELQNVRENSYPVMGRDGHAKREPNEIGVHSLRMGNVVGEHEVIIATPSQTIKLKHEAHSRALFAEGALTAAEFLVGKAPGLYTMKDLV